jgi:ABC-2 type transport system ATP-binding protein
VENGAGENHDHQAHAESVKADSEISGFSGLTISGTRKKKRMSRRVFDESSFHENMKAKHISKVLSRFIRYGRTAVLRISREVSGCPRANIIMGFSRYEDEVAIAAALSHHRSSDHGRSHQRARDPIVLKRNPGYFPESFRMKIIPFFSPPYYRRLEKAADYVTFIHEGQILFAGQSRAESMITVCCSAELRISNPSI